MLTMAADYYAAVHVCSAFARNQINLLKNSILIILFSTRAPLKFFAIDILGASFTKK